MKVRVVKQHNLKAVGFFEKCQGKEFQVIWKREGGYDVDLAPLGFPGTWGYMYDDEVKEIDQATDLVGLLAEYGYDFMRSWVRTNFKRLSQRNPDGSLSIRKEEMDDLLRQAEIPFDGLEDLQKVAYRENCIGRLKEITDIFKTVG